MNYNKQVLSTIDLSGIQTSNIYDLGGGINYNLISVQLDWDSLTGNTLNATVKLLQRNDVNMKWSELSELSVVMDSASDTSILENSDWGGQHLGVLITMNDCTGGNLNIVTISKVK